MGDHAQAAMFVVALWWASTGLVLRLAWLEGRSARIALGGFSVLAAVALWGVHNTRSVATPGSAYLAFACALAIWGWHELAFLLGAVSGPRPVPCPAGARGWSRFRHAAATLLHHEVALAVTLLALGWWTWGAENPLAARTFGVLWLMRLSAKLNVFFGVRNFTDSLVHPRQRHLLTYFRRDAMTPLLPAAILVAVGAATWLSHGAWTAESPHDAVHKTLLAVVLALAALEHLFLAVRLRDFLLWRWILPASTKPVTPEGRADV